MTWGREQTAKRWSGQAESPEPGLRARPYGWTPLCRRLLLVYGLTRVGAARARRAVTCTARLAWRAACTERHACVAALAGHVRDGAGAVLVSRVVWYCVAGRVRPCIARRAYVR